jgi:hypothetical protein
MPVAIWGLITYFFILIGLICIKKNNDKETGQWGVLFFIYLVLSLVSLGYGYISLTRIQSLCIVCLATYLVNWLSLFTIIIVFKRYKLSFLCQAKNDIFLLKKNRKLLIIPVLFLSILLFLTHYYPRYWEFNSLTEVSVLNHGYTRQGIPWTGAANPEITIVEYSDYQCFACKKAHYALRRLMEKHPGKIRLVHRNFPMSSACNPIVKNKNFHKKACILAKIAICAKQQNIFWKISDALFFRKTDNIKLLYDNAGGNYTKMISCLNDSELNKQLMLDIKSGIERGVTVTPSFFVYGKLYKGKLPIKKILKDINLDA